MSQCKCGRSVYSARTTSSQYDLCDMCSRRCEVAHAISQARAVALRWVLEQIEQESRKWNKHSTGIVPYKLKDRGAIEACVNLRAIIEKELG